MIELRKNSVIKQYIYEYGLPIDLIPISNQNGFLTLFVIMDIGIQKYWPRKYKFSWRTER